MMGGVAGAKQGSPPHSQGRGAMRAMPRWWWERRGWPLHGAMSRSCCKD